MTNGSKINYVTPEPIYSRVKEEMRSYFNTGSIDDLLFPTWTADCLDKLENTYRPIQPCVMDMWNGRCDLPCDFFMAREVWMCATFNKGPIVSPHVFYYQTDCRVAPYVETNNCASCSPGTPCNEHIQQPVNLPNLCGVSDNFIVTNKVMSQLSFTFSVSCLLKPGNFNTMRSCHNDSPNTCSSALDTFDIIGNHMVTSFQSGTIYMSYYATRGVDPETGYYTIPDNDPFSKYLYYYLRFMVYQQLFDQSTDETFNQIRAKRDDAEGRMNEAYINAKNYAIADDIYGVQQSIIRSYNRNNRYLLVGPTTRVQRGRYR